MAVCHSLHKGGVAEISGPDGGQEFVLLFDVALGLGQDDEIALVPDGLKEPHRDGVRHAAVQQAVMADLDDLCRQRHGSRGFHPEHILSVALAALMIDGLTRFHIGADHKEIHGGGGKGRLVERIQLFGHLVVAELLTVQVARFDQIFKAGVALIVAVLGVVADDAADLV